MNAVALGNDEPDIGGATWQLVPHPPPVEPYSTPPLLTSRLMACAVRVSHVVTRHQVVVVLVNVVVENARRVASGISSGLGCARAWQRHSFLRKKTLADPQSKPPAILMS